MRYKPFLDISLSRLGMGNMRLPTVGGVPGAPIDYAEAQKLIDYAMEQGVNYYDTAYVYHKGESEKFLGAALKKFPRDSFYIATKFLYQANSDYRAVFSEQLERLQTDHIDFYLIHSLGDRSVEDYLNSGCIDFFEEQKRQGRIRYLGFSSHASVATLERFADSHKWDFAQIQLNYLDWLYDHTKEEYEALTKRGIPVMVMEPVRGGRLASLDDASNAALKAAEPERSIASWALRWVMRQENVQVILSGMTRLDQVEDNVATFAEGKPLSDGEEQLLFSVAERFHGEITIPCTGCRYCTDDCPKGIDIPRMMTVMNEYRLEGSWALGGLQKIEEGKRPGDCIACGACAAHCPQGIDIPSVMAALAAAK